MTKTVTAREAAELVGRNGAVLIDVRAPDEFRGEHIPCALSLPLDSLERSLEKLSLKPDTALVFQCQRGARGEQACLLAERTMAGRAVFNLEGGITAWKAAGLPVMGAPDGRGGVPSIFRQVQMAVGGAVFLSALAGFAGWSPGFALAGAFGFMLLVAGLTGWCGLAMLLARAPWNMPA